MMRYWFILVVCLCATTLKAQSLQQTGADNGAEISFSQSVFDFGTIYESKGSVSHDYQFINSGNAPLVITKIITSCSCTKASFPKKPILAGERAVVTITYDPRKQSGVFYKAIQVYSNGKQKRVIITAKGNVVATNIKSMYTLIKDCLILPMDRHGDNGQLYFRGSIGLCGERIAMVCQAESADYHVRVAEFEKRAEAAGEFRQIDGRHFLAMPGLINIHNHASMSLMRSYADDMLLMPWLKDKIWPFEAKLRREDIVVGAELGIAEMLLGGTTTFVDMYWQQEAVAEAVEKSGIRAVLSPTFTDTSFDDFQSDLKTMISRYGRGENSRISMMIAPHAPYSCSTKHLEKARDLCAEYGLGINIHVAETAEESAIIAKSHAQTPIEYLNDLGLLTPKTIAVHSVHLSDRDIFILKNSGASVAHNPQSNMKIASGVSPVAKMVKAGINVGLGTDGPCSNNDLDMWEEMRSASFLQKLSMKDPCVMPAYEVLKMATVCGAKAIGRGDELGALTEGMLADIILIDVEKPHLYPRNDMVANLVYCGKSSDVDTVIIAGEILMSGRHLLTIDLPSVLARSEKCVDDIKKLF